MFSIPSFENQNATIGLGVVTVTIAYMLAKMQAQRRKDAAKPWPFVPGWVPVLGHFHIVGDVSNLPKQLVTWANKHGTESGCFEIDLAGVRYIVICREDRAKEILKDRPKKIFRSTEVRESLNSLLATGVFTAEGDQWKQEHKLVAAALNRSNVRDYLDVFKQMSTKLIYKWKSLVPSTTSALLTVKDDLGNISADAISKVAMDRDYDFLNNPTHEIARDVNTMLDGFFSRALSPFWYWRIPFVGQYLDGRGGAIKRIDALLDESVTKQQKEMDQPKKHFLYKLLLSMNEQKQKVEHHRLKGNISTLFIAGTDTSSKTLMHVLHILAKDQDLQETLRKEVNGIDLDAVEMQAMFDTMPRLKSFLHEVHLHYNIPVLFFETASNETVLQGYRLEKGTPLIMLNNYISTSPIAPAKIVPLGPNGEPPSDFCPERFLVKDGNQLTCPQPTTGGVAFGGFGYGMRTCPGKLYSETLSLHVLASTLQEFQWELPSDAPPNPPMTFDIVEMVDWDTKLKFTALK